MYSIKLKNGIALLSNRQSSRTNKLENICQNKEVTHGPAFISTSYIKMQVTFTTYSRQLKLCVCTL